MNKVIFVGRSGAGKTTLTQALSGEGLHYAKTQDVKNDGFMITGDIFYRKSKAF